MTELTLEAVATDIRTRVNARLDAIVPAADEPPEALHRSMRYSLMGPGKRIRPLVTMLAATHFGGRMSDALDPACAVEMVHTASLILDDLPFMDDASYRRGQPANHMRFGVDTAQLAAMALLNQSFAVLSRAESLDPVLRLKLVEVLSDAIGSVGLIAGQARDLRQDLGTATMAELETTNDLKTATLFVAGTEIGARVAGVPEDRLDAVRRFARYLGLAFQVLDDILDASASKHEVGKDVQQDRHKATFVTTMGMDRARSMANHFIEASVTELEGSSVEGNPLSDLARSLRLAG
jgi:geranylgeranyl diphosphate synthase type II